MSESPTKILNKTLYILVRDLGLTPQEVTHLRLSDLHLVGKNPYLTLKMEEDGPVKRIDLDLEAHRTLVGWLVARPDSTSDLLFVNAEAEALVPLDVEQAIEAVELEEGKAEPELPEAPPKPAGPPEPTTPIPPRPPEEAPERGYVVRDMKPGQSRPVTPVRPAPIKPPPFAPEAGGSPSGTRPVGPIPSAPPPPPVTAPEADEGRDLPGAQPPFGPPSRPVRPVREQPPAPPAGQKSSPVPPVNRRELGYTPRAVSPQKVRTPPPPVRKSEKEPAPELMSQEVDLPPPSLSEEPAKPIPSVETKSEAEALQPKAAPPSPEAAPVPEPEQPVDTVVGLKKPVEGEEPAVAPVATSPKSPEGAPKTAESSPPAQSESPAVPAVGLKKSAETELQPQPSAPAKSEPSGAPAVGLKKSVETEVRAKPSTPVKAEPPAIGLKKPAEATKPAEGSARPDVGPTGRGRLTAWSFGVGGILLLLMVCAFCGGGLGYLTLQSEAGNAFMANLGLVGEATEEAETAPTGEAISGPDVSAVTPNSPPPTPTLPPTSTPTELPPTDTPIPTETATPPAAVVETPTATPVPTDTPLPTDTPTPEPPPATPTPAETATPAVEPTPGLKYGAPVLIEPENEFDFIGGNTIVLRWQSVGELASDEQYAVRVSYRYNNQVTYQGANIKETEWTFPTSLYNKIDPPENRYEWFVVVERLNEDGSGTAISPESEHRTFTWK